MTTLREKVEALARNWETMTVIWPEDHCVLVRCASDLRALLASPEATTGEAERMRRGLLAVEAHHTSMNRASLRPLTNSTTLRIVKAALMGCGHLFGDACGKCQPSVPCCARHPDAPVRRFGPLWRCSECGEDASLLRAALAPSIATRLGPNPYAPPAPTRDGTEERRLLDLYRAKRAADGMNGRAWDAGIHFPADEALREAGEVPESIATWDAREALRARVNALAAPPRAETGREER
jgi:hypothetical protein